LKERWKETYGPELPRSGLVGLKGILLKLGSERRKPTLQMNRRKKKRKAMNKKENGVKGSGSFFFLLPS